jgi:hypothetical protein
MKNRRRSNFDISITAFAIVLFLLLVFATCASLSPVSQGREKPLDFTAIENVEPTWQVFAEGIDFFHGKITSPNLEFWALRINLSSPDLRIVVRGGSELPTAGNSQTFSTKVSSFVRDNNLIAGINAVPFDVISSRELQPIKNMGIVVSDGTLLSPVNSRYDALVFYKNGTTAIVSQSSIQSINTIENAVGGFHQILDDGQTTQRTQTSTARHPRSAAGISENGKILYLLVIDGRRVGSIGATELETALLLHSLGSKNGINLDGGGSSSLALRYPDGKVRVANRPVHGGIPGRERAVAGSLGVFSGF